MNTRKNDYKVIIWGLGSVGRSALEIINARKSLKLVAAYDVDPKRSGKTPAKSAALSMQESQ